MITPEDAGRVLAGLPRDYREFFEVLMLTGMRPTSEAGKLTAGHLDHERRRAAFAQHKNAKKTGKPRLVYFPPAAWEIVARRAEARPRGPLFLTTKGKAIDGHSGGQALRPLCRKLGIEPFPPYTFRHFMITTALGRGVPVDVLAQLVGNSPQVLRASYSQMGDDAMAGVLADAAARAVS